MLKWLYHKIMPDIGKITNMKVQPNTKIKFDAKSFTKCITFITYEREKNYHCSITTYLSNNFKHVVKGSL